MGKTTEEAIAAFRDTTQFAAGWYTGGKWPYQYFIEKDGTVFQCLPLTAIAPAAKSLLNRCGLHIALHGDFRKGPPTAEQEKSLKQLYTYLQTLFKDRLRLRGHTDEAGASSDPNKICPGPHLDLSKLKA